MANGGAAVIRPLPGRAEALVRALREVDGVCSVEVQPKGFMVVGAEPGRVFAGTPVRPYLGVHGGPATARTLSIVAGGSPVAALLTGSGRTRPGTAWAPMLAGILGLTCASML